MSGVEQTLFFHAQSVLLPSFREHLSFTAFTHPDTYPYKHPYRNSCAHPSHVTKIFT